MMFTTTACPCREKKTFQADYGSLLSKHSKQYPQLKLTICSTSPREVVVQWIKVIQLGITTKLANPFRAVQISSDLMWRHQLFHKAGRILTCYSTNLRSFVCWQCFISIQELGNGYSICLNSNPGLNPETPKKNSTLVYKVVCNSLVALSWTSSLCFNSSQAPYFF